MPLAIFSHQGLVMPMKIRSPKSLDGTALLIGAGMTDCMVWVSRLSFLAEKLPYPDYLHFIFHSLFGMLFTLPLSIIFACLFSSQIAPWLSKIYGKKTIGKYFGVDDWVLLKEKKFNWKWLGVASYSAFLGIISHYFMDIIGHNVIPFYLPFQDFTIMPGWYNEILFYMPNGSAFYNAYILWLLESIIFGILSLVWLRLIKKHNLLNLWYGKADAEEPTKINVWTGYNEYEFKEKPPFESKRVYLKGSLHFGSKPLEFWAKPSKKNIILTLLTIVIIDIAIEWGIELIGIYIPPPETAPLWQRLFSMSHIMAYIGILSIIYDEKYLRSWFILFIPLLVIFIYVIAFKLPGTPLENQILPAIASHAFHFIIAIYLIIRRKWTDWQYLIHAGIVYFSYFLLLWILIPDYKMIWIYGLPETLTLVVWSTYIITITTAVVQHLRNQGKSRGPIIKDGDPET